MNPAPDRAWLDRIDQLRYEDPQTALDLLLPELDQVSPRLHPLYFGVYGSTWRNLAGRGAQIESGLSLAHQLIVFGQWIAAERGDSAAEANLELRLSYVLADRGSYAEALSRAEHANAIYEREGDVAGRGKALVDQGRYLYYLGRRHEALRAYSAALRLLPKREKSYRCSAYHASGVCHLDLGRPREALRYARLAEPLVPSPAFEARLRWFQAKIHAGLEEYPRAETCLVVAIDILRRLHYGDAALAAVELVKVQLLQRRSDAAWRTAVTVRELVIPLSRNRIVSAALLELLRGGRAALTLRRVEAVRAQILKARERQDWCSLRVRA